MFVADELENLLDTKLTLGRIHLGLLNRIVIEDLMLDDRSGKEMLKVTRFSAKFDILPLFKDAFPSTTFNCSALLPTLRKPLRNLIRIFSL